MAFGSAAARTDLEFTARTGEAKRDITELRRVYHQSTGAMSDDALRLAIAQEKLDRAIARHGPTSLYAKQATLGLRREMQLVGETASRTTGSIDREERSISRLGRGALAGSGLMRGLGRSVAFASASFLGGAGLVFAIKSTIAAGERSQVVLGQTRNAVERAGLSWAVYGSRIREAALEQSKLSGFDDERLLGTFANLLRRTKNVTEALQLNALAADVARGRNISLEQASLLVIRASLGMAGALRRLGIDAKNGATGVQLLELLQRKYAGSAEAYGRTAEGAQDRFRVAIENTQEAIATDALPQLTLLLNKGADWLNDSKNQERVVRDVERALHDAGLVAHGLAGGFDAIRKASGPVIGALGGLEHAVEVALILGLVVKARRAGLAFGLIRSGSAITRTAIVADAAVEDAALTSVGLTASTAGARVAAIGTRLRALRGLSAVIGIDLLFRGHGTKGVLGFLEREFGGAATGFFVGGIPGAIIGAAAVGIAPSVKKILSDLGGKGGTHAAGDSGPYWGGEGVGWVDADGHAIADQHNAWVTFFRSGNRGRPVKGQTPRERKTGQGPGRITGADIPPAAPPVAAAPAAPRRQPPETVAQRLSRARLDVARKTPGAENELLGALRATVDFDRRYERIQEDLIRRGIGNRKQHLAILERLRSEEESALGEISSIEDERARKQAERERKAAARARAAKAQAAREHAQRLREVSTLPKPFGVAENEAKTLRQLGDVYRSELEYQKRLVAQLRAQHAAPDIIQAALLEESKIDERIRKNRLAIAKKQRAARDAAYRQLIEELGQPSLPLRIRQAKLSALKAEGKDTAKDELALLQDELAEADREYALALKLAKTKRQKDEVTLAYWQERADILGQIAELKAQQKQQVQSDLADLKEEQGALTREFAAAYLAVVGTYAPNYTGGSGPGRSPVVINQNFPSPPSENGHREATWAKLAAGAAWDG